MSLLACPRFSIWSWPPFLCSGRLASGGICAPTSAPLVGSHLSKGVSRTGGRFLALLMRPIRRVLSLPSDCFPKALRPRRTVPLPSTAGALFYSMAAAGDLATRCQTVQCRRGRSLAVSVVVSLGAGNGKNFLFDPSGHRNSMATTP